MPIQLVGDGPAIETAAVLLEDIDAAVQQGSPEDLAAAPAGIVAGASGADVFDRVQTDTTYWIGVEVGGLGSVPLTGVDASVAGFGPKTGCYSCLRRRVEANDPQTAAQPRGSRHAARLAGARAAFELIDLLTGTDRISGAAVTIPGGRHRFLPTPGCRCQPTPDDELPVDVDERGLEAAVEAAETAIDPRTGVIAELGEADSFPAPYYLAQLASNAGFSDGTTATQAAGVAVDWNPALMKAVGEAFERYAAGTFQTDAMKRAPVTAFGSAVGPSAFPGGPAEQPAGELLWERGTALATGTQTWLPADAVRFPQPGATTLPAITTGLATASSTGEAVYRGGMEVIERDAAMIDWYSTGTAPAVVTDDPVVETLTQRAASVGLSVQFRVLTQDIPVPVVAAQLTRDHWPNVAVAAAADLDGATATRSALAEAIQNWMELRAMGPEEAKDHSGAVGHYAARPPEIEWFFETEGAVEATALGEESPSGRENQIEWTVDQLATHGLSAYGARLTTVDLETLGFEVVRVVVPGAQPLFVDEPIFSDRADAVPPTQDATPKRDRPHHPYP